MTNENITLWCNVKGDSAIFFVEVPLEHTIAHLKKLIRSERKQNVLSGIDTADLVLWKVRHFMIFTQNILMCLHSLLFK